MRAPVPVPLPVIASRICGPAPIIMLLCRLRGPECGERLMRLIPRRHARQIRQISGYQRTDERKMGASARVRMKGGAMKKQKRLSIYFRFTILWWR